jgi:hypothetical protein
VARQRLANAGMHALYAVRAMLYATCLADRVVYKERGRFLRDASRLACPTNDGSLVALLPHATAAAPQGVF